MPDGKTDPLTDAQFASSTSAEARTEGENTTKYYVTIGGQEFELQGGNNTLTDKAKDKTLTFRSGNLKVTNPTSLSALLDISKKQVIVKMSVTYDKKVYAVTATVDLASAANVAYPLALQLA